MRTRQPITPLEHALLGLLSISPRHGYDLIAQFIPGSDLGLVTQVPTSQVYSYLWRLERRGQIASSGGDVANPRQRRVYHLTAAGRAELQRWLRQPVERIREIRQDFLIKLYFADRLEGAGFRRRLVQDQIATCERYLERLETQRARLADRAFAAIVVDSRINAATATIRWLAGLIDTESALVGNRDERSAGGQCVS